MRTKSTTKEPLHYGAKVKVNHNSRRLYTINPESPLNQLYRKLTAGEKAVLQSLLKFCSDHVNLIHIGGETLEALCLDTGYTSTSIRNAVTKIKRAHLIEPTGLKGEYIINPLYAIKGNYSSVWRTYQVIESQLRQSKGNKGVHICFVSQDY